MYLPRLKSTPCTSRTVSAFGGYRHDERAGADRFYHMENLSARAFPAVAPRLRRKRLPGLSAPNGLYAHGALLLCDGTDLLYDGAVVGQVTDSPKQFVALGARVVVWPDKLCFDTIMRTLTPLGNTCTTSGPVAFSLCNLQAEAYTDYTVGVLPPETPEAGALWLDTGETPNRLKRYSQTSAGWVAAVASYIKVSAPGIGAGFRIYDGVRISGCAAEGINGSFVLYAVGPDYILLSGTLDEAFTQTTPLTISREIPDFDFLCAHDNRVWGCSNARHEIACCKLGDPGNWQCAMGISTDSYTVSVGTEGDFTGCCAYGGYALFFKEDCIHKLMGTKPGNYQLSLTRCRGVAPGSHRSLAIANETLYYHARSGVCAYTGALPALVGQDLGGLFTDAVAGSDGEQYYCSMKDAQNEWHLFVYDPRYELWHREDATHALGFACLAGGLYTLTDTGGLWALKGGSGTLESRVRWCMESGELCERGFLQPQRLVLRLQAEAGCRIRARLCYDGGPWQEAGLITATRKRPVQLPLRLRRCDSLRLRLEGEGNFLLHAMTLYTEATDG